MQVMMCVMQFSGLPNKGPDFLMQQRYIFPNYSLMWWGNTTGHLGKNGEENWYIRTFYTFSDKKGQNFVFLVKL